MSFDIFMWLSQNLKSFTWLSFVDHIVLLLNSAPLTEGSLVKYTWRNASITLPLWKVSHELIWGPENPAVRHQFMLSQCFGSNLTMHGIRSFLVPCVFIFCETHLGKPGEVPGTGMPDPEIMGVAHGILTLVTEIRSRAAWSPFLSGVEVEWGTYRRS